MHIWSVTPQTTWRQISFDLLGFSYLYRLLSHHIRWWILIEARLHVKPWWMWETTWLRSKGWTTEVGAKGLAFRTDQTLELSGATNAVPCASCAVKLNNSNVTWLSTTHTCAWNGSYPGNVPEFVVLHSTVFHQSLSHEHEWCGSPTRAEASLLEEQLRSSKIHQERGDCVPKDTEG